MITGVLLASTSLIPISLPFELSEPMSSPNGNETSILVASFQDCSCNFGEAATRHASIEFCRVRLYNAVAISYTYGAFNRQPRLVGHVAGRSKARPYLELG